ncbi:hypothetical protein B566_EDAN006855 [Ephemera danica]|nr:hypothetical protein B566_EDAN006855 [Ephemera danica]
MSSLGRKLATNVVKQAGKTPTGTIIFLHGSGDSGSGILEWIKVLMRQDFAYSHLRIVLPSAPPMPYTLNFGQISNVWFDRTDLSLSTPEHLATIDAMAENLKALVQTEVDSGIPINRIAIGGFSMGGAMSLHLGYRFLPQIAGIFGLSCFLNENSTVYEAVKKLDGSGPPLFMAHGEQDSLIPCSWGRTTFEQLTSLKVQGKYMSLPGTEHELNKHELKELYSWILEKLPVI